jgi:hypothetical protein
MKISSVQNAFLQVSGNVLSVQYSRKENSSTKVAALFWWGLLPNPEPITAE